MQEDGGGGGQQPIIIKKVVAAAGHHGGAWKVAYADFVTAMMALFMVLWLMNANQETQEAVAAYFKDPKGVGEKLGSGQAGTGSGLAVGRKDMEGLAQQIQDAMNQAPEMRDLKDHVEMTVTAKGLRIELLETEQGMFFESGSPSPSKAGREILGLIVRELNALPNRLALEDHTDSRPFRGASTYTNWELSVDRANSARRILVEDGLAPERIAEVTGFADQQARNPENPGDPSNRRISLIVMYADEPRGDSATAEGAGVSNPAGSQESSGAAHSGEVHEPAPEHAAPAHAAH